MAPIGSGEDDRGDQEIGGMQAEMRRQRREVDGLVRLAGAVLVEEQKSVGGIVDDAIIGVMRRRTDVETGGCKQSVRSEVHQIVDQDDLVDAGREVGDLVGTRNRLERSPRGNRRGDPKLEDELVLAAAVSESIEAGTAF